MASNAYARLIIGGTLQQVQGWSIGLAFALGAPPTDTALFSWLGLVHAHVDTWAGQMVEGSLLWGSGTRYSSLAAYGYAAGSEKATAQANLSVTPVVGTAGDLLPPQCAVVHSLLSGAPGRKNRGRVYVPISAANSMNFGQLTAAACTSLAGFMANLLSGVAGEEYAGSQTTPCIATTRPVPTVALGSVGVDSIVDTQRRRTDKIVARTPLVGHPI